MCALWEEPLTESLSSLTVDNPIDELSSGDNYWSGNFNVAEDVVGNLFSLDESWGYSDGEGVRTEEDIDITQLSLTKWEPVRLSHLRQHLDRLRGNIDNHKQKLSKIRNELLACLEKQSSLLEELNGLEVQVVGATGSAGLGMLHGKEKRLKAEGEAKRKEEVAIKSALCTAEVELLEAEAAAKQYAELEAVLDRGEAALKGVKDFKLLQRLQAECKLVMNARKKENRLANKLVTERPTLEEGVDLDKQRKAAMQRVLTHQRASQERAEEDHRQHLEGRIKAILSLKKSIAASEDTIQAQHLLRSKREQRREEKETRRVLAEGRDPEVVAVKKKRTQQFQAKLDKFQKKQEQRKVEIVARLLREEHSLKHTAPKPAHHIKQHTPPRRSMKRTEEEEEEGEEGVKSSSNASIADQSSVNGSQPIQMSQREREEGPELKDISPGKVFSSTMLSCSTRNESRFMQPEIRGLWDEAPVIKGLDDKPPAICKTQSEVGVRGGGGRDSGGLVRKKAVSKTEVRMMQTAMERLKESIFHKQVAAGREFKGVAFSSQPAVLSFLDFEVGKTYKRKVKLTNISYTLNHCKLQGTSSSLADTVTVKFDPSGAMSAGMTCHMLVTFHPQLEEDVEGSVQLLSETGPFSIPVQCRSRKCTVKLQDGHEHVHFGPICVGEIAKRHVIIHNTGALSTLYTVTFTPGEVHMDITGDETSALAGMLGFPEPFQPRWKLSNKSELSVMTDVGAYGGSMGEHSMSVGNKGKSKSASNLSVYVTTSTQGDNVTTSTQGDAMITSTQGDYVTTSTQGDDVPMSTQGDYVPMSTQGDYVTTSTQGEDARQRSVMSTEKVPTSGAGDGEDAKNMMENENQEGSVSVALPAIRVDGESQGVLAGLSSQYIQLLFSPVTAARYEAKFFINFSHTTAPTLEVGVAGCGVVVPVYLEQDEVDLQICLLDRLYQRSIQLHNRVLTARQVTFKVPSDLQAHLEVLPGYSLVQGQASLDAQLKFRPGHALLKSGPIRDKYVTSDGRWRMVVEVEVKGQRQAVSLTVLASVCPSALLLPDVVEFGACTTHETVISTLSLTNTCALPQSYGFVHLPPCLDVQPGDGFGKIFPGEILQIDLLFSPEKSKDYEFEIVYLSKVEVRVHSEILQILRGNHFQFSIIATPPQLEHVDERVARTCKVQCKGRGVLPPLVLSANSLRFPPTRLGSSSTASFTLTNSQLSRHSSAVIRRTAPARGTRAFHFRLPPHSPLTLSPLVGLLEPGQRVRIDAHFSPRVTDDMVLQEAARLHAIKAPVDTAKSEAEKRMDISAAPTDSPKKRRRANLAVGTPVLGRKSNMASGSSVQLQKQQRQQPSSSEGVASSGATPNRDPPPITARSVAWCEAHHALLTSYANTPFTVNIPCFVSSTIPSGRALYDHTHRTHQSDYTVYLEVSGVSVKPELVLAQEQSPTIDFGTVGTGEVAKRFVKVQNVSVERLSLHSSALDPLGPFTLRNALRDLSPHATHTLLLHFSPQDGSKSYDRLLLYYGEEGSCLELHLVGEGVHVNMSLTLQDTPEPVPGGGVQGELSCVDLGNALAREGASKSLCFTNHTSLPVHYKLHLSSQLPHNRHVKRLRGLCASGRPVFSCVPCEGTVERDQVKVVKVTFDPDRQSSYYSDKLLVEYNGQLVQELRVVARAWMNTLYVTVTEDGSAPTGLKDFMSLLDTTESLCCPTTLVHPPSSSSSSSSSSWSSNHLPSQPLLVMFLCSTSDQQMHREHGTSGIKREIVIGCIKSALLKKQSGEFNIEPLVGVVNPMTKCFTIEPHKASVEAGGTRTVSITFTPPKELTSCIEANFTVQCGFQTFGMPVFEAPGGPGGVGGRSSSHLNPCMQGLQYAVRCLAQLTATQYATTTSHVAKKILNQGRIIFVLSLRNDGDVKELEKAIVNLVKSENGDIKQKQDMARLHIHQCQLVIVHTYATNNVVKDSPLTQLSSVVSCVTYSFPATLLLEKCMHLAKMHFDLKSTIVTGIPMKEEQAGGSSANYDVELIHLSMAHRDVVRAGFVLGPQPAPKKDAQHKDMVTLRWSTPKATSMDLQFCTSAFRVTPSNITNRPTICLINFVLSGKSVLLEQSKKGPSKVISHILSNHAGAIFLHCIPGGRSYLDDPPSISEGWGGRITDYRITDFNELVLENLLSPLPVARTKIPSVFPLQKALAKLEYDTRYWPMVYNDTILYTIRQELEPLPTLVKCTVLSEQDFELCKRIVLDLQARETANEPLAVPSTGGRNKGVRREEQYRSLWGELEGVAKAYSSNSDRHHSLCEFISKTMAACPSCSQQARKVPAAAVKLTEGGASPAHTAFPPSSSSSYQAQTAWQDLDKYQQMTEREKTDYNLGNTNNSLGNWKTLGPNPSFPMGAANGATPLTLPAVGKPTASLLQLWTSRQKEKTQSCHTEFAGRSYGEVKAELYPQMRSAGLGQPSS